MTLNKKHCLIFLALFVILLIGATTVSATTDTNKIQEVVDNKELSTPANYDVDKMVQSSVSKSNLDSNVEKTITSDKTSKTNKTEYKQITKNTKTNTKQATQSITVNSYSELKNRLTSDEYEDLTVTLDGDDSNYIIDEQISVNETIKNLIINGNDRTIDGKDTDRFLEIGSMNLTLNNIKIKNCHVEWDDGGVIYANEYYTNITLKNSVFTNNKADWVYGGVIYQRGYSSINVSNCTFEENQANEDGSALYQHDYSTISVTDSKFINNKAESGNGAIYQYEYCNLFVNNSRFDENYATQGGAIYQADNSNMTICYSNFTENKATKWGGAICNKRAFNMNINDSIFISNRAAECGGALYVSYAAVLNRCNFTKNTVIGEEGGGGAIFYDLNLTINNSNFTKNTVIGEDGCGGAICDYFGRSVVLIGDGIKIDDFGLIGYTNISYSKFINNTAKFGAVLYESPYNNELDNDNLYYDDEKEQYYLLIDEDGEDTPENRYYITDPTTGNYVTITNSEFTDNEAESTAGVLYLRNTLNTDIDNNNFTRNKANKGVMFAYTEGDITITNSNFTSNYAATNSTIIWIYEAGVVTFEDNTFDSNWVGNVNGWVMTVGDNTKIIDNIFINNTDNTRDMLFDKKPSEVTGNTYIDNYLNDTMDDIDDAIVSGTYEKDVNLYLRDVYNDLIRNGTLKAYVNDKQLPSSEKNVVNGKSSISINSSDLVEGENTITVRYVSLSKHYQNMTKTFKLTKNLPKTKITVMANSTVKSGQSVTITGNLSETDNDQSAISDAKILIFVNGENVKNVTTNSEGIYSYDYPTNSIGIHYVDVIFEETSDYKSSNNKTEFNVLPFNTNMTVNAENVIVNRLTTISGTLYDTDNNIVIKNQKLIVRVGENYINDSVVVDSNGNYELSYNATSTGVQKVRVFFITDNERYFDSINTTTFTVFKDKTPTNTSISVDNNKVENVSLTVRVTDDQNNIVTSGTLQVITPSGNVTVPVKSEKTVISVDAKSSGIMPVTVNYLENDEYKASSAHEDIPVIKLDTTITVNVTTPVKVGKNTIINGVLLDENKKLVNGVSVQIKVDGKEIASVKTDADGKYSLTTNELIVGTHNVESVYAGDEKYMASEAEKQCNIIKDTATISLTVPVNAKIGQPAAISGRITDSDGKPVANMPVNVTVNGKTIKTITDDNGKYEVVANNVVEGTNNVKVSSGNAQYDIADVSDNFVATRNKATITVDPIKNVKIGNNVSITGKLVDEQNNPIKNAPVKVTVNADTYPSITDNKGKYSLKIDEFEVGRNNVSVKYENALYNTATNKTTFNASKTLTRVTVHSISGIIGEDITLTAYVTDEEGNPVTGGNLVFKLNGRTLREDGRFDTNNTNPLKLKVKDGIVTFTMKAEMYMRNAKNITASYSGTNIYESAKGNIATFGISKRYAQVKVNILPNSTRQNSDIVFSATLTDVTKNGKNTTCLVTGGNLIFKINGVTIKNKDGSKKHIPVTRSVVNYVYHVPTGTGGVNADGSVRDYTVEAVYDNDYFYPDTRNSSAYNVQRSKVNINFLKTTVKNNKLSVKATFTDFDDKYLVGNNKVCVKINGKTYQEDGKTKYFTVKNGRVNLSGIKVASGTTVKSVMLVTGARQAYLGARATTKDIITA